MEMSISEKSRTVEVWLNTQEAQDPVLKERLGLLCQIFAAQKYMVAVFRSGSRDLVQSTSNLLCYNRKRIAQLEVEHEKQMGLAR